MEGFVLEGYDYESILADVENLTENRLAHGKKLIRSRLNDFKMK